MAHDIVKPEISTIINGGGTYIAIRTHVGVVKYLLLSEYFEHFKNFRFNRRTRKEKKIQRLTLAQKIIPLSPLRRTFRRYGTEWT